MNDIKMASLNEKHRITVNLEEIDYRIIEALNGVISNSDAGVIYQMIREWINQNSDQIMNTWDIDLGAIRRQVLAETKGVSIKKEIEKVEEQIIKQLPNIFNSIEEISAEEAAEFLEVNPKTLKKIIFIHNDELEKKGLKLSYKDGIIINNNLKS
ncbi:MAG: hypothetical protein P8Y70_05555 [Candidatus Lokiarchaeota archaeon]